MGDVSDDCGHNELRTDLIMFGEAGEDSAVAFPSPE